MNVRYYYVDPDGETVRGPHSAAEVRSEWTRRGLSDSTLCTREGEENWRPFSDMVEELYSTAPAQAATRVSPHPVAVTNTTAPAAKPMPVAGKLALGCAGVIGLLMFFGVILNATHPEIRQSGDDGYNKGYAAGKFWAERGHGIPTEDELHAATLRVARNTAHPADEYTWVNSYETGFASGYKDANKPAF